MKKKLIVGLCVISLSAITTVLAADGILTMNTSQFQEKAIENSRQAVVDDLDIKEKETALEDAKEDAGSTGSGFTRSLALSAEITKYVSTMEAESALEVSKRQKVKNQNDLKLDTYKATMKVLLSEKQLEIEKQKYDIIKEQYEIQKAKYDVGNLAAIDLYDIEYNLEAKEIEIEKINKDISAAELELKKLLNVAMDGEALEVTDELELIDTRTLGLDFAIEDALENNIDVYEKEEALKAKEKAFELADKYYGEGDTSYDTSNLDMEAARLDYENVKDTLVVDIKNKYNDMLNEKDQISIAEKYEELQQDKMDSIVIKYDLGTVSKEDYLNQKEALIGASFSKYTAIYNYNICKAEFDNMVQ